MVGGGRREQGHTNHLSVPAFAKRRAGNQPAGSGGFAPLAWFAGERSAAGGGERKRRARLGEAGAKAWDAEQISSCGKQLLLCGAVPPVQESEEGREELSSLNQINRQETQDRQTD